jgi:hypothetical protein
MFPSNPDTEIIGALLIGEVARLNIFKSTHYLQKLLFQPLLPISYLIDCS